MGLRHRQDGMGDKKNCVNKCFVGGIDERKRNKDRVITVLRYMLRDRTHHQGWD
jgi:hypothetical protein